MTAWRKKALCKSFAARRRRNQFRSFLPETAFSAKILLAERSVRAIASAWSAAQTPSPESPAQRVSGERGARRKPRFRKNTMRSRARPGKKPPQVKSSFEISNFKRKLYSPIRLKSSDFKRDYLDHTAWSGRRSSSASCCRAGWRRSAR